MEFHQPQLCFLLCSAKKLMVIMLDIVSMFTFHHVPAVSNSSQHGSTDSPWHYETKYFLILTFAFIRHFREQRSDWKCKKSRNALIIILLQDTPRYRETQMELQGPGSIPVRKALKEETARGLILILYSPWGCITLCWYLRKGVWGAHKASQHTVSWCAGSLHGSKEASALSFLISFPSTKRSGKRSDCRCGNRYPNWLPECSSFHRHNTFHSYIFNGSRLYWWKRVGLMLSVLFQVMLFSASAAVWCSSGMNEARNWIR